MDKARALEKFLRDRGSWPPGLRQPSGMDWQQVSQAADLAGELVAELDAARNEMACCDDVPLDGGLASAIAALREQRDTLRQQLAAAIAERDRAVNAIKAHNADYGECDKVKCGYAPYKYRECPECPAQHKIDLAAIDAGGEGETNGR